MIYKLYIIFFIFFLLHCQGNSFINNKEHIKYWVKSDNIFGTTYTIVLELNNNQLSEISSIESHLLSIFDKINHSFSLYNKNSKIVQLNQNHSVIFDKLEIKLFELSKEICLKTKGYFFPFTKGTLINLKKRIKINIKNYSSICNLFWIEKKNQNDYLVQKKYSFIEFDFNAIAKGYTVDLIKEYFIENQWNAFLIEIGGEICVGNSPKKNSHGWLIALENPFSEPTIKSFSKTFYLSNQCLASSGNYLQEHILNPFGTIKNKNKRVTVFGPSCAIADAYATYLSIYEDGELYSNDYYIQYDE